MIYFNYLLIFLQSLTLIAAQGFYQNTDVLELSPQSFDQFILKSNYTSIIEFYAPWCGHCRKLKPSYKKVGKQLKDLVQVGAINCDLEINKPLCGQYKIEGFPTIKIFRPPKFSPKNPRSNGKKDGFVAEDYTGERSVDSIVNFVQTRIKSYVRRVFDEETFKKFKNSKNSDYKMLLISDSKKQPSLFLKSLAIDYLGLVEFAYLDNKKFNNKEKISKVLNINVDSILKPMFLIYENDNDDYKIISQKDLALTKENISEKLQIFFKIRPVEGPGSVKQEKLKLIKKGKNPFNNNKKISKKSKILHDEL